MRAGVRHRNGGEMFGLFPLLCMFLGRLHHKTIHAELQQASEKRQDVY
jgi:hypothetical protein